MWIFRSPWPTIPLFLLLLLLLVSPSLRRSRGLFPSTSQLSTVVCSVLLLCVWCFLRLRSRRDVAFRLAPRGATCHATGLVPDQRQLTLLMEKYEPASEGPTKKLKQDKTHVQARNATSWHSEPPSSSSSSYVVPCTTTPGWGGWGAPREAPRYPGVPKCFPGALPGWRPPRAGRAGGAARGVPVTPGRRKAAFARAMSSPCPLVL